MSRHRRQLPRWTLAAAVAGVGVGFLAAARVPAASTYTGTFTPLNNSGVSGTSDLTLDGSTLTVSVTATGLEANQQHVQHIHGFADNSPSVVPAVPPDPTIDTSGNGIIEDAEAQVVVGPPILGLSGTNSTSGNVDPAGSGVPGGVGLPSADATLYPTADATGNINYTGTFTIDPTLFSDLTLRTVELHGLTQNGTYDATLPVASAAITLVDNGGGGGTDGGGGGTGGGGGGGTPIPLPAGVLGGAYLLSGLAGTSFARKRLRRH